MVYYEDGDFPERGNITRKIPKNAILVFLQIYIEDLRHFTLVVRYESKNYYVDLLNGNLDSDCKLAVKLFLRCNDDYEWVNVMVPR